MLFLSFHLQLLSINFCLSSSILFNWFLERKKKLVIKKLEDITMKSELINKLKTKKRYLSHIF